MALSHQDGADTYVSQSQLPMGQRDSAIVNESVSAYQSESGTGTNSEYYIRNNLTGVKVITVVSLLTAFFLCTLDNTIVSTCLPRIGSSFNEFTLVSWVANGYILAFDACQPLFSKFNDIFGRKWSLLAGICVFSIGSLLCGISTTIIMLIVCRVISGIGAAGILSAVTVIVHEMAPLEKRGNYQGLLNGIYAISGISGPLVGGSFADGLTWRWAFYINVPIGIVSLVILVLLLDLPTPQIPLTDKLKCIDYAGIFTILSATILFLLGLNFSNGMHTWQSAQVIVPLVLSVVFLVAFGVIECKYSYDPIMPPRLFKNGNVVALLVTTFLLGANFFIQIYFLPLFFQILKGDSAMWSGIRLFPMQIGICITSIGTGRLISRTGSYRPFVWVGTTIITLEVGLLSLFDADTSFLVIYGITFIGGIGFGPLFSAISISLQASVEPKDISIVIGLGSFCRLLGNAVGMAVASTIFNSSLADNLPSLVPPEYVLSIINSSLFVRDGLPEQYRAAALQVFNNSLRMIWYVTTPLAAIGIISSIFIKHYSLRRFEQETLETPERNQTEKASHDNMVMGNTGTTRMETITLAQTDDVSTHDSSKNKT